MADAQQNVESIPVFLIRVGFPDDLAAVGGWLFLALSIWFSIRGDRQSGFEWLMIAATAFLLSVALTVMYSFRVMSLDLPVRTLLLGIWEYVGGSLLFSTFGVGIGALVNLRCEAPQKRSAARYWILIPLIALFDLLLMLLAVIGRLDDL